MTDTIPRRSPLNAITGLRFCAALWVVSHHYIVVPLQMDVVNRIIGFGPKAVLLFFILSGFILTYVYAGHSRSIDLTVYFRARFARIYPLYTLGIVMGVPLVLFTPHGHYIREHLALALAMFFTGMQAWYPFDPLIMLNDPLWSLSVELFFYALFPLLVPCCYTITRKKITAIVLCVAAMASYCFADRFCYYAASFIFPGAASPGFIWGWHPIVNLPLFVLGMLLGSAYLHHGKSRFIEKSGGGLVGDAALVCILALIVVAERFSAMAASMLFLVLFAYSVFWFASAQSPLTSLLASRPFRLLGNASFALYITHAPLWHYYEFIYTDVLKIGSASTMIFRLSYLCMAIATSVFLYRFFEVPARTMLRVKRE